MTKRPLTGLVAWAVVAMGLAGCAGSGAPVEAPQPTWQSGYAWTYSTEVHAEEEGMEDGERFNETATYQWRVVSEVLNSTLSQDGERYYIVGAHRTGDWRGRSVDIVRARDLASLEFSSRRGTTCLNDSCASTFQIRDVNLSAPTFLDFPLERGKRWGGVFQLYDLDFVYQAEVDGAYQVDTGLGPMEAARTTVTVRLADEAAARRAILEEAEEEGYKVDEFRFSMSQRSQVYYSEAYQAVVRVDRLVEESFVARGTDPDGERFDFRGSDRVRSTTVVEGAQLLPRPERSLDEVAMFLDGQLDLRDPTGQLVVTADYRLAVHPPTLTVNAGAKEPARFEARIEGERPADHTLHWRLVAEDGSVASRGEGITFDVVPSRPGRYAVEVETRAANASVAAAGASLIADWSVQKRVDCGPVSAYMMCVAESLPVHPGARSLLVRVSPVDVVDGFADVLWVTDSAGSRITGQSGANGWTVQLDPIAGYLVDQDPWRAEFRRGVAALSQADVEIEVRYGATAASGTPAASGTTTAPSMTTAPGTTAASVGPQPSWLPWKRGPLSVASDVGGAGAAAWGS